MESGADYGRIHRLLRILMLIQGDSGWTARKLAAECGTSVRNIYRDMKELEGAGVPYYFDTQTQGYRVRRDFFMPAVDLTLEESLAVIWLGQTMEGGEQIPFLAAASRAIAKIRSALPDRLRQQIGEQDPGVDIQLARGGSREGIEDVYHKIRQAQVHHQVMRCRYEPPRGRSSHEGEEPLFQFHPYRLFWCERAWYVIGHHETRGEVRQLKLNRFSHAELTTETFEIPRSFSMSKYLGNAWRMIKGKKSYDVEIHFDAGFGETIAETLWHPTQEIEWREDDSIVFRCKVDGLDEIIWWVMSMGPFAKVVKPAELAKRVKDLADRTSQRYAKR
ncbi:MAG: transcriptional regulator [Phycisphaeraceae bacterium]|nr:transcriptional regulator [Phycisphaeraceae bacterium]